MGLDFSSIISSEEVGLDPRFFYRSSPSGGKYLFDILKRIDITEKDSIIDVGCGKGSAMRTMLKFSFGRVDGMEASEKIAESAVNNFKKLKEGRVKIFACDATDFDKYEECNFFYFYNPFPCQVMLRVIEKIKLASQNLDKEIFIIYNNPICHNVIVNNGFNIISDFPDEWGNKIYLYSNSLTSLRI